MEEHTFEENLFGGIAKIITYNAPKSLSKKAAYKAFKEAKRLHKIFNFYDQKSELSSLNKKRKLKVSKELLEVLKKALKISKLVKGYDVSKGKEFLSRKEGKIKKVNCSYKDIKINKRTVCFNNDEVLVDLGSVAKGYITDKIGEILKKNKIKEFVIDSRGDILFGGLFNHVIEIEHPRRKGESIEAINVSNEAVATSGDYNQFQKSFENSHIVNKNNFISVTVVHKNLCDADLYATAIMVSKKSEREKLLSSNKNMRYFLADKNLKVKRSKGLI